MVYTDEDRLANYTGGVDFWRPDADGEERGAQSLSESGGFRCRFTRQSCVRGRQGRDRAVRSSRQRQRVGNSEHAEYYTDEGKIILTGGEPKLNDSKRGNTKGDKLTYFTDDNRLIIEGGAPEKKAQSHLRKKS